jgi:hypothetical protein
MNSVKLPLLGGCVCGAVRYSVNSAPVLAYACHCHNCQKRSGSAFGLTVIAPSDGLSVTGPVYPLRVPGVQAEHTLCSKCFGRLFAIRDAAPAYVNLRAGSLDDAGWVKPGAQTWTESALPWAVIPDVPAVPGESFDLERLSREWLASAPRFER